MIAGLGPKRDKGFLTDVHLPNVLYLVSFLSPAPVCSALLFCCKLKYLCSVRFHPLGRARCHATYPALPCSGFPSEACLPVPPGSHSPASDPPAEMHCSLPSLEPTLQPADFLRGRCPPLAKADAFVQTPWRFFHARLAEYPRSTSFPP